MKAITREKYGPPGVIEVKDLEKPTPADNQVLVKVGASSINKTDWYDLNPPFLIRLLFGGGARRPKVPSLGTDLAGTVESVGSAVSRFKPGDEVFGVGPGALAEYAVAREERLALKPPGISFEDCGAAPVAGVTALQGLKWANIRPGQRVLVDGSSGGVGSFAIQIARSFGAEVTAVCSESNVANARSLGADAVVDYTKEDFTKSGTRYDVIAGVNGFHSIWAVRRALEPTGIFVMIGSHRPLTSFVQVLTLGKLASNKKGRRIGTMGVAKITPGDLDELAKLMTEGKVKPLIERRYPLEKAGDAFRYFGEGHVKGKVVVTV